MNIIQKIKEIRDTFIEKDVDFLMLQEEVRSRGTDKLPVYPIWYYSPIRGIPRNVNISDLRKFAKSTWVQMVTNTIKKTVEQTEWDIVIAESEKQNEDKYKEEIEYVKAFLNHPNRIPDSTFDDILDPMLADLLEIDAGVWYLHRNGKGMLMEILPYDSSTFLKEQDINGFPVRWWQFSFKNPQADPKGFDIDEICYFQMNNRTYNPYGFCMPWDAVVETNAGKELIGEIVSQKKDVLVKTYNEEKNVFEFKRIKNYFSRHYNKQLYKICIADSERAYLVRCTDEHPILTNKGFVPAKNIKLGDKVMVCGVGLSKEQKEFIYGSLLGDSTLITKRRRGYPYYTVTHAEKEKYYVDWIERNFANLNITRYEGTHPSPHYPERIFKHHTIQSRIQPCLDSIRRITYPDFKKRVTEEWVDKLTPLSIAAWMMDDGSYIKKDKEFVFCTDSFSTQECELLMKKLNELGIESRLGCPPSTNKNRIFINTKNTTKLFELVKDYIIIENDTKKWVMKDLMISSKEEAIPIPVTKIELTNKKGFQVYDIEVEDNHNFITNKIIVHNSPLQSVQQVVELLIQSTRYNKDFFFNNAIPSLIMNLPNANKESLKHFYEDWMNQFQGKPHKILMHNAIGHNIDHVSISNKDMEWLAGQKWYMHLVFGVYGLSPVEAGFYEDALKAGMEGQARVSVKNAILPYLNLIEKKINRIIIPSILNEDKIPIQERTPLVFKYFPRDAAQEKIDHEMQIQDVRNKIRSINEIRAERGLPPFVDEKADNPFVFSVNPFDAQAMINLGGGSGEKTKPEEDKAEEDDEEDKRRRRGGGESIKGEKVKFITIDKNKKKPVHELDVDEWPSAEDYADLIVKMFDRWEKKVLAAVNEINKGSKASIMKSFGEFLRQMFTGMASIEIFNLIKMAVNKTMKKGLLEAEEEIGADIGTSQVFNTKAEGLARQQFDGYTLPDGKKWHGIKGVSAKLQEKIYNGIKEGMMNKEGTRELKERVQKIFKQAKEGQALRIARTESARFVNEGKLQAYKDSGVPGKKRYVAFIDDKTSDVCRGLHGQVREFDEPFNSPDGREIMIPPAHPSCRSFIMFERKRE